MDGLPEDCIAHILSRGLPRDACQFTAVASVFRNAAESELLWDKFLPSDHQEILSRSVHPMTYKSKKELFFKLCNGLLIDGGLKTFAIDKLTVKRSYMLSARELYIAWSANPLFWCWKPIAQSRFDEAVELRMTSWLEVQGKINTRILSPNTNYGAYLIVQVAYHRAYGLDVLPSEVSIEVGEFCSRGMLILSHNVYTSHSLEHCCDGNRVRGSLRSTFGEKVSRICCQRSDGWLEIELGNFYNDGILDKDVKMSLREVAGVHLKGGLIVEGLEIRPI